MYSWYVLGKYESYSKNEIIAHLQRLEKEKIFARIFFDTLREVISSWTQLDQNSGSFYYWRRLLVLTN